MYFTYEQPEFNRKDPAEIRRVIKDAYLVGKDAAREGKVADYIPELAKADGNDFGICVKTLDGETIEFGDVEKRFSGGMFVDSNGRALGTHKGYPFYTVGQRKGLGVALGYPAYVLKINPVKNTVITVPIPSGLCNTTQIARTTAKIPRFTFPIEIFGNNCPIPNRKESTGPQHNPVAM